MVSGTLDAGKSDTIRNLNCAYDGPAKAANSEQTEIIREICPHLMPEVRLEGESN